MTPTRGSTASARLARLGFTEPDRAATVLSGDVLAEVTEDRLDDLLAELAQTADPDAALARLAVLVEATLAAGDDTLLAALASDPVLRRRLLAVLGASQALAEHLGARPASWRLLERAVDVRPSAAGLRHALLVGVHADPGADLPVSTAGVAAATDLLRLTYRDQLLGLAARDVGEHQLTLAAGQQGSSRGTPSV